MDLTGLRNTDALTYVNLDLLLRPRHLWQGPCPGLRRSLGLHRAGWIHRCPGAARRTRMPHGSRSRWPSQRRSTAPTIARAPARDSAARGRWWAPYGERAAQGRASRDSGAGLRLPAGWSSRRASSAGLHLPALLNFALCALSSPLQTFSCSSRVFEFFKA